jgi:hypothetical protein
MTARPKLTREQVLEIRKAYATQGYGGAGQAVLANRYGVEKATIYRVLNGTHALARDLPNISGIRGHGMRGFDPWPNERAAGSRPVTVPQVPGAGRAARLRVSCPVCEATPGQLCRNPKRPDWSPPLKTLHPARKAPAPRNCHTPEVA